MFTPAEYANFVRNKERKIWALATQESRESEALELC